MSLLRTPLAHVHEALGARMVPFAGWLMPIQYEGIVAEHLFARASAGLFDLSHMGRIFVGGPDAASLLQYVTTNDAERLRVGRAQYSLICNEDGGIVEDLLVYRLSEGWRLVVNAVNRETVLQIIESCKSNLGLAAMVKDETFELAMLAVQGPASEAVLGPLVEPAVSELAYYEGQSALLACGTAERGTTGQSLHEPEGVPAFISRTGYTGEDGFEIIVAAAHAEQVWDALLGDDRARPAGLGARDTLRLEAGMPLYGHELTQDVSPYEAGLGRVVRLTKGPFLGRDALTTLHDQEPACRLVGLEVAAGAVPRSGFSVLSGAEEVGVVASGSYSPTLRHPIATALIRSDATAPGTSLRVQIRDAGVPATVVSLPFVPHHTKH